jgi:hypothetical protein
MFTVILSVESVNFFTFSLIYLCKSESQKVLAQFTDVPVVPTGRDPGPRVISGEA